MARLESGKTRNLVFNGSAQGVWAVGGWADLGDFEEAVNGGGAVTGMGELRVGLCLVDLRSVEEPDPCLDVALGDEDGYSLIATTRW